ncbi:MAG: VOC family protein [Alphaproteobacteria bacterium]
MHLMQYYPVIQTDDVAGTAAFYQAHFGFKPMFEADWYVHLQSATQPEVNLAILQHDHETIPERGRGVTRGLILNFETEDVDDEYRKATNAALPILKALCDEDFGQRHFITHDPNGILIDVIKLIAPTAAFAEQYATEAVPA